MPNPWVYPYPCRTLPSSTKPSSTQFSNMQPSLCSLHNASPNSLWRLLLLRLRAYPPPRYCWMSSIGVFHLRLTWYVHFMSNGNYCYLNTLTQITGPTVDVLSAHHKCQKAPCIPSPYQLQQLLHSSSIVSSSTLNTHQSQQNLSTRTSQHGVTRHIHVTSRRSNASISANSQPPKRIPSDDKLTVDNASKIYVSDLSLKNLWPDKQTALSMAEDAALQANHCAKADGRNKIDSKSPSVLRMVCLSCISRVCVLTYTFRSDMPVQTGVHLSRPLSMTLFSHCG